MSKKRLSEKDLLEGLTSNTAHSDELATTSEKDQGAYSEDADKADSDFLVERRDVFDSSELNLRKMNKTENQLSKEKTPQELTLILMICEPVCLCLGINHQNKKCPKRFSGHSTSHRIN